MENIGFVGLGVMGQPMAGHLAAAGFTVTVYDLNQNNAWALAAQHETVTVAASLHALGAASDIVVTMLPSGRAVQEVLFGTDGLLEGLRPGCLLLDTSSSEPWYTVETARRLGEKGVHMVDAPVSGAEMGAKAAKLVFMVGGEEGDVARLRPLFDAMGKTVFHLGPTAAGHAMKSINNLITAVTFQATTEGLVMGKAYNLDPAIMTEVLNASTGMSWISQTHIAQRILSRRFDDPFKLDLMMKDVDIALQIAVDKGLEMPLSQATQTIWHQAQDERPRGCSVSELVRALELRTGIELTVPKRDPSAT